MGTVEWTRNRKRFKYTCTDAHAWALMRVTEHLHRYPPDQRDLVVVVRKWTSPDEESFEEIERFPFAELADLSTGGSANAQHGPDGIDQFGEYADIYGNVRDRQVFTIDVL